MYLIKASYHVNNLLHTLIDPHDVIDIIGQYNLRNAQMDVYLRLHISLDKMMTEDNISQFSSVQLLSRVRLFATS